MANPKSPTKVTRPPMAPTEPKERVETCPSFRSGHLTTPEDLQRLRTLTAPHVDSFDYFWEQGLARGVQDIEPAEFNIVDPQKLRDNPVQIDWNETSSVEFWVEHAQIAKPAKAPGERSQKLLPRECRERKLVYAGQISATFCYRMIQRRNGVDFPSRPVRLNKTFGDMPIMVMSKGCHLEGTTPKQLVKLKEEVGTRKSKWRVANNAGK
jgi:DNA-directed RNA polymerase I subunit RPA2